MVTAPLRAGAREYGTVSPHSDAARVCMLPNALSVQPRCHTGRRHAGCHRAVSHRAGCHHAGCDTDGEAMPAYPGSTRGPTVGPTLGLPWAYPGPTLGKPA